MIPNVHALCSATVQHLLIPFGGCEYLLIVVLPLSNVMFRAFPYTVQFPGWPSAGVETGMGIAYYHSPLSRPKLQSHWQQNQPPVLLSSDISNRHSSSITFLICLHPWLSSNQQLMLLIQRFICLSLFADCRNLLTSLEENIRP
jgi:hypothetical protein